MSLHDQIKLPPHVISSDHPNHPSERWSILEMAWIRHRDLAFTSHARHAAAELAIASDARIEALEQDNASLREQNSMVDAKCAELEAKIERLECPPKIYESRSKRQTEHELEAMKRYIEKITKDKDSAVGFLSRAGIIDGSGQLAEQYRNVEAALLKGQP